MGNYRKMKIGICDAQCLTQPTNYVKLVGVVRGIEVTTWEHINQ